VVAVPFLDSCGEPDALELCSSWVEVRCGLVFTLESWPRFLATVPVVLFFPASSHLSCVNWLLCPARLTPKNGDTTNIVWKVVDKSLSTLFKKSAMRDRFGQVRCANVVHNLAMKVMYSALVYMYNANKVMDNAIIIITYA